MMTRLLAAWILILAPVAAAQQPRDKLSPGLEIGGQVRSRLEMWDWFGGSPGSSYAYSGNILRLSLEKPGRSVDWKLELAAPVLLGLPDDAILPAPAGQLGLGGTYYGANGRSRNAAMIFPKQAFVRLRNLGGSDRHSLRLGRFEFIDGSETTPQNRTLAALKRSRIQQRLIGNFGFSHVGRSFDGLHYAYDAPGANFTVVAALPTRGVFQVDGWGHLDAGFGYASFSSPVGSARSAGELRLFGIYHQDWRAVVKADNRPAAERQTALGNIRIGSFGGHYLHAFETGSGTFDLSLWGVVQTGRWDRLDHAAAAYAIEGGIQPVLLSRVKPWLRAGMLRGTGDDNAGDKRHGTFFQLLPTPRPYARFPFYNFENNRDFYGMLALQPHPRISLTSQVHALRLDQRQDLWYLGGGAFQPWTFGYAGRPSLGGRGLATTFDVEVGIRAASNISVTGYIGIARGKSVLEAIYPDGKNGRFGFLELVYSF